MVSLLYSPRFLDHDTQGLSEDRVRLDHAMAVLRREGLPPGVRLAAPRPAGRDQVALVHTPAMIERLERACRSGGGVIDAAPTVVSPASYEVALLAAGAAVDAARSAMDGEPAFALVRPPGHHATPDRSMGFCLFNNAAIAARQVIEDGRARRVLLVDFDLHHGNGTQDIFYLDPGVLYVSLHQYPIYPGTGRAEERGSGPGEGTTINVPLPDGAGDAAFAQALDAVIVPAARRYRPDLILCSCGYDAHWAEDAALGAGLRVSVAGFHRMAAGLRALAVELCAGRLAGVLEGGYHLDALAWGVLATLAAFADLPAPTDPLGPAEGERDASSAIQRVRALHGLGGISRDGGVSRGS